ncbi:hypothetical protein HDV05_001047 [Chytridiales sp. JEL 0842]|nr:hypothetical protein HDV05_001047 [Chytridiales sp. JEL 0842]
MGDGTVIHGSFADFSNGMQFVGIPFTKPPKRWKNAESLDSPTISKTFMANGANRIGVSILGHLNLKEFEPHSSGGEDDAVNVAFGDQRLAIEWVFKNIGDFGGDAKRVTLWGQSAGCISAIWQANVPSIRDRLQGMVLMSPPNLPIRDARSSSNLAQSLSNVLGCGKSRSCMEKKTTRELLIAFEKVKEDEVKRVWTVMPEFLNGKEAPADPFEMIRQPSFFGNLSIIIGNTANETASNVEVIPSGVVSGIVFDLVASSMFRDKASRARDLYVPAWGLDYIDDHKDPIIDLTTDFCFVCPMQDALNSLVKNGGQVYEYYFESTLKGSSHDTILDVMNDKSFHGSDFLNLLIDPEDGSGKTTLLHTMCRRMHSKNAVFINDRAIETFSTDEWNKIVRYVPQTDAPYFGLTVKEILTYRAMLENVGLSFDWYQDRDIFDYEVIQGDVSPWAFILHRFMYESATLTVEGAIQFTSLYYILGANPDPVRALTCLLILMCTYHVTVRNVARNIAMCFQTLKGLTAGILVRPGETPVFDRVAFLRSLLSGWLECKAALGAPGDGTVRENECRMTEEDQGIEELFTG